MNIIEKLVIIIEYTCCCCIPLNLYKYFLYEEINKEMING